MSEKVSLYHSKSEGIEIWVEASFENGNLLVEGYDIGKVVEDVWGDSDYEYSVRVTSENMPTLCKALNLRTVDETALLSKLKEDFSGNYGFSNFIKFLKKKKIEYLYDSWT